MPSSPTRVGDACLHELPLPSPALSRVIPSRVACQVSLCCACGLCSVLQSVSSTSDGMAKIAVGMPTASTTDGICMQAETNVPGGVDPPDASSAATFGNKMLAAIAACFKLRDSLVGSAARRYVPLPLHACSMRTASANAPGASSPRRPHALC